MTVRILRKPPLLAVLAGAALLSGCMTPASGGGPEPLNPGSRWALQTAPGLDQIALAVHDGGGLSGTQRRALADLIQRHRASGDGPIVVQAPSGDDESASRAAFASKTFLESLGVGARVEGYAAPDPRAPVLVGFTTVTAVVPNCSGNWNNMTATRDNGIGSNFGCSIRANMAAQIADPRHIRRPADQTAPDAGRRSVVLDLYRRGQLTSAVNPGVDEARVSQAVQ